MTPEEIFEKALKANRTPSEPVVYSHGQVMRAYSQSNGLRWEDKREIITACQQYDKSAYYGQYAGDEPSKHFKKGIQWILNKLSTTPQQSEGKDILREFAEQFLQDPYPEDIFLPISKEELKKIHEILKEQMGMPIDRLTGHIGRLLRKPLSEQAKAALKQNQTP